MKQRQYLMALLPATILLVAGCANEPKLGRHVDQVKMAQTYNPNASEENRDVLPEGIGEKMESSYRIYLGQDKVDSKTLQGSTSTILKN